MLRLALPAESRMTLLLHSYKRLSTRGSPHQPPESKMQLFLATTAALVASVLSGTMYEASVKGKLECHSARDGETAKIILVDLDKRTVVARFRFWGPTLHCSVLRRCDEPDHSVFPFERLPRRKNGPFRAAGGEGERPHGENRCLGQGMCSLQLSGFGNFPYLCPDTAQMRRAQSQVPPRDGDFRAHEQGSYPLHSMRLFSKFRGCACR